MYYTCWSPSTFIYGYIFKAQLRPKLYLKIITVVVSIVYLKKSQKTSQFYDIFLACCVFSVCVVGVYDCISTNTVSYIVHISQYFFCAIKNHYVFCIISFVVYLIYCVIFTKLKKAIPDQLPDNSSFCSMRLKMRSVACPSHAFIKRSRKTRTLLRSNRSSRFLIQSIISSVVRTTGPGASSS